MRGGFLLCFMSPSLMSVGKAFHATSWCGSLAIRRQHAAIHRMTKWQIREVTENKLPPLPVFAPPRPVCPTPFPGRSDAWLLSDVKAAEDQIFIYFLNSGLGEAADRIARLAILAELWRPVWLLMGRWHPPRLLCIIHELLTFSHAAY